MTSTDPADEHEDGRRYDEENITRYQPEADNYGKGMPPGQGPAPEEGVDEDPGPDENEPAKPTRKASSRTKK